jgi:hypothetical protein
MIKMSIVIIVWFCSHNQCVSQSLIIGMDDENISYLREYLEKIKKSMMENGKIHRRVSKYIITRFSEK